MNRQRIHNMISLCALLLLVSGAAASGADSTPRPPFILKVHAGGSYNAPLGTAGDIWERFPMGGIYIDFPGYNSLFVRGEIEAGYLESIERKIPVSQQSFSVGYNGIALGRRLIFMPRAGITNFMIYPGGEIEFDTDPFAPSENEFGIAAGGDIVWEGKYAVVTVPLSITTIFSTPDEFVYTSVSIRVGREF